VMSWTWILEEPLPEMTAFGVAVREKMSVIWANEVSSIPCPPGYDVGGVHVQLTIIYRMRCKVLLRLRHPSVRLLYADSMQILTIVDYSWGSGLDS
jgi:hypothetical protein